MGMQTGAHIVWDWNGTLFHDNDAIIGATNAAFAELGLSPITLEQYRALYCVPVPKFYERLMGRLPTDAEWEVMDATFHRHYTEHRVRCGLTEGVAELLADWRAAGRSQSILSMYGHEELVPLVKGFGIESHFVRVDGRTGPSGGSKAEHMVRHLAELAGSAGVDPTRTVVIGDAADDAVAAGRVRARAVLYTGGSHSRASLEGAGVPVVDTLAEAVVEAARLAA
ncbi:HAD family hydrolase [Streptomyces sp. SS52]|uniref:HAD family hydrolase n=1 Tax=Streptomyces sp. SS52 TaxID=2563602 RepID=UPI00109EBEC9|nr:HAD family hydrolase [Streptomyces sp. SS52]QCB22895.1 HAD family hydrolase [Streptomyces sp. SS52]